MQGTSRLRFAPVGGRTVLAESHVELPLQIQRPIQREDGTAVVTLLTPAGALFDGDAVQLEVVVEAGARVALRQASATHLRRSTRRGITAKLTLTVADGARCSYTPHELIPFADADYHQSVRVYLAHGAEAYLTEVVSPGRIWEHFRYRRLALRTAVFLDAQLIALDATDIVPAEADCLLALGGHTHFGTLLHLGPAIGAADADRLHERFAARRVCGSASLLPTYGVGARVLGSSAQQLLEALSDP